MAMKAEKSCDLLSAGTTKAGGIVQLEFKGLRTRVGTW